MSKVLRTIVIIFMAFFLVVASLVSLTNPDLRNGTSAKTVQNKLKKIDPEGVVPTPVGAVAKVFTDINKQPLTDNPDVYQKDDPSSVVTMYLTVRKGNDLENTNHTWQEVNNTIKYADNRVVQGIDTKAEAILQIGDENGPLPGELGYDTPVTNSTVQIRGSSTSQGDLKSYKVELFNSAGSWRGQKTINLNKHIYDLTRVRNKLAFDLLKGIPNMVSLRTQFVHLYVKDETSDPPKQAFEDYGLFTQVEQPNKTFLKSHLLDRYGQLYKAIMFEFYSYPDQLKSADDPQYNKANFETVLEIKGNNDHTKLLKMLDDVNNWAIPINKTFEKYFDADNYFTWMAFNILMGNLDTNSQNFFLYSPQNAEKWYFLPWDYDGSLMRKENEVLQNSPYSQREQGVSNYWGVVLHQRVLTVPEYRQKLDEKMDGLLPLLTPDRINKMLNVYRAATEPFVNRMPDMRYLAGTPAQYDRAYSYIPDEVQTNYALYKQSLESPMPFYLGTPKSSSGSIQFNWAEAYDFNAEDITYHFSVSKNWDFKELVEDVTLTNVNQVTVPQLEPGTYFWRVTATNERGKTQEAFDYYMDSGDVVHNGMKYLYVTSDGKIYEK